MRIVRIVVTWWLIVGLSSPALARDQQEQPKNEPVATQKDEVPSAPAGSLRDSVVRQAQQAEVPERGMPRAYLWGGTALFVGGMAAGIYGFLNNENGEFPEFGEAESTNTSLGTVGLIAAFGGGTILFLGARRANRAPSVTVGPQRVTVSKQISW